MLHDIQAINQKFRQFGEALLRWRWLALGFIALLTLAALLGLPRLRPEVSIEDWFVKGDPLLVAKEEFNQVFGNYQYVGVLVEANDVFAPDILRMIRQVGDDLVDTVPYADRVISLTNFEFTESTEEGLNITNLVPDEIPSDPETIEAIRQRAFSKSFLVNRLFSADSRYTWITLRLRPYPTDLPPTDAPEVQVGEAVLALLRQSQYQQPHYTLRPAGMPAFATQEIAFFNAEASRLILLAFIIAVIVLFAALRTVRGVLVPLAVFFGSIVWVFGAMGYLGVTINQSFITLPIYLGLAEAIAYAVHIFNFFNSAFAATGDRRGAVLFAIEEVGWPTFFTAATTIGSLFALAFVPIKPIRWMGFTSAAVVLAVYVLIMIFIPVALSFGPNRTAAATTARQQRFPTLLVSVRRNVARFDAWGAALLSRMIHFILRRPKLLIVIFILVHLGFLAGARRVTISTDYERTYGLKIPYVGELYSIARTPVGSMYSYEVTVTFNQPDQAKRPENLKNLDVLIGEIRTFPLVKRVSSLLDILKDLNQTMNMDEPAFYRVPDEQETIAQLLLLYEMSNGKEQANWVDYEYTTLRVMVEVTGYNSAEAERNFQTIRRRAQELFPDAKIGLVGTLLQLSIMQNYVAKGELVSFFIALVVIALLMILVFQSVRVGLIGMIPNVAPLIVIIGFMGYADIPLDMTTMLIIPILLGLAVDDTIHFINHCKLEFQRTHSYRVAIEHTYLAIGKAIFMTSFILIASFAAYLTSVALGFRHLAILMILGVSSALLSDFFITPILIFWSQPFGKEEE